MTAAEETEMHSLAEQLEKMTRGTGWEMARYWTIGRVMQELAKFCAVCDCQRQKPKRTA